MDMLSEEPQLDLNDPQWRIFTRSPNQPAAFIAPSADVQDSIVNEGCIINGEVKHSVLFFNVEVGEGSVITDSVIMPGAKIGKNVRIHRSIVNEGIVIEDGAQIGVGQDENSEIELITSNQS